MRSSNSSIIRRVSSRCSANSLLSAIIMLRNSLMGVYYDGWGTYFEDPDAEYDDEEGEDDEEESDKSSRLH